jgi:hypothetical protein
MGVILGPDRRGVPVSVEVGDEGWAHTLARIL